MVVVTHPFIFCVNHPLSQIGLCGGLQPHVELNWVVLTITEFLVYRLILDGVVGILDNSQWEGIY